MKNILIFGGGFENKGGEAMSFVSLYEMKKRFPEIEPILLCRNAEQNKMKNNFKFSISEDNDIIRMKALKRRIEFSRKELLTINVNNIIKIILGKPITNIYEFKLKKLLKETSLILDISGYALSSSWRISKTIKYLNMLKLAEKYNVPIYLMPQSFGPFEYKDKSIIGDLKRAMKTPRLIFAREKEGYDYLTKQIGLTNVVLSTDLVLQSRKIDYEILLQQKNALKFSCIDEKNNVAILPNMRVFERCNNEIVLKVYRELIDVLLSLNKNVYLLQHSEEDIMPANSIKKMFFQNKKVILVEEQFSSYQFEEIVQQFDYIIASRYHSIVHAYKQNIPVVAIGWAVKYVELLGEFNQSKYIFDIRTEMNIHEIINAVKFMNDNYLEEKKAISQKLKQVQKDNCFELVEKDFRALK